MFTQKRSGIIMARKHMNILAKRDGDNVEAGRWDGLTGLSHLLARWRLHQHPQRP
jgi:hypothetical protein